VVRLQQIIAVSRARSAIPSARRAATSPPRRSAENVRPKLLCASRKAWSAGGMSGESLGAASVCSISSAPRFWIESASIRPKRSGLSSSGSSGRARISSAIATASFTRPLRNRLSNSSAKITSRSA
jgi:hypothetical protein